MKNSVKLQQIALLVLTVISGGKYLSLPALLSLQVGRDSWLVMIMLFVMDFLCMMFLLWAVKANTEKLSINEILCRTVGKIAAKIIFGLMFLILTARVIVLLSSSYKLFSTTFTVHTTWPGYVIPLIVLVVFVISRGFTTIARLNQILYMVIFLSVVLIIMNPLMSIDVSRLKPLGENGVLPLLDGVFNSGFWFADYIFIYFVFSDITAKKYHFMPVATAFAIGACLAVVMDVAFVALLGEEARFGDIAMSKVSQFSLKVSTNGRADWLALSVWTLAVFVKIFVFTYCAYKCIEYIAGFKDVKFNYIVGIAITVPWFLPLFVTTEDFLEFFLSFMRYPVALLYYILPLFMPLLVRLASKKRPETLSRYGGEIYEQL